MQDARIATGLPSHPKTKKLLRRLGPQGGWSLMCLFLWVAANRPDGDLAGMSAEDIELAVDWPGGEGELARALCEVGFLDGDEGTYAIHDWAEHNPWAAGAERRADKARFAALCRRYGRAEAARMMPDYAASMLEAEPEQAASTPDPATSMPRAELDSASSMPVAGSSSAPSPNPSPNPSPEQELSSLRSDSSSAAPKDGAGKGASSAADKALRLAQVTDQAIAAWNASPLVKPGGGLLATVNPKVGRDNRQLQVRRCISIARDICLGQGQTTIPPEFWVEYFAVAARDDFHSGRQGGGRGHENWLPDFEFMTQPKTMLKLFEREEAA